MQYADGTANFMYLIGSQTDGTLGWAAVQIGDLQTAPAMIQTGDGSTESSGGGGAPVMASARWPRRSWSRPPAGAIAVRRRAGPTR